MNDFTRYDVFELRTLVARARTLQAAFLYNILLRALLAALAYVLHLDTRLVFFLGVILTAWVSYAFFRYCAATKLPSPWLYLLVAALCLLLLPLVGLLLIGALIWIVNNRVFRARGIRVGLLGPSEAASNGA
ncbi:hypothetical protein [Deinococcus sp.]|uniref:hypothetical protein n=1 Tax=Deinococcus sp. TaxID=47478 RepID=UPI003CC58052